MMLKPPTLAGSVTTTEYQEFIKRVVEKALQRRRPPTHDDLLRAAFEDLLEQMVELRRAVARLEAPSSVDE